MSAIRAVAYYRMSTLDQENSIDRQRSQVVPYAAGKGLTIVREYIDEGIAGDEAERRKDFMRMLRDAERGDFQVILCDDKDRFGRFDSISYGYYVKPLRDAGVLLDAVAQGVIDWTSFAGRITDAVLQEAKHLESQTISRRVLSMQLLAAKNGDYTGGRVRYGYRAEAGPGGKKRWVPDGRKAEVVQLIFGLYDQGHSLGQVAEELYRRGVASPNGNARWSRNGLLEILRDRKYVGDWKWGGRAVGKWHRNKGGALAARAPGSRRRERNGPADWIVKEDNHEAIVDRELFQRVQARLTASRRAKGHAPGPKPVSEFVLTRLLVCSECGSLLQGYTKKGRRIYRCGGYATYGRGHCHFNPVGEKPLLDVIVRKLQDAFLNPDNLQKLRDEMARIETAEKSTENRDRLRSRYKALQGKVDGAYEKLILLPPDQVRDLSEKIAGWKREAEAARAELQRVETGSPAQDLEAKIREAEAYLWRLQDALGQESMPLLRNVLLQLVSRVELRWSHTQAAKTTRNRLEGGAIFLRPQEEAGIDTLSTASEAARALRAAGAARVVVAVLAHSQS